MKTLHKRILSAFAVVFLAFTAILTSFIQPQFTVFAAGTNETQYEKTNVLDDLQGETTFNIQNYPFQETATPQMHVINVVEYCYSFRANQRGNYGLYLYVYNPNGQDILTDSLANKVQIAVAYDSSPVTSDSKPTDYDKFRLQFCSKSTGEYKNLFYKFKVIDKKSADGKTIAERVNSMARRYDISGIELHTRGMDNAIEYPLTGAYALTDTHKGYGSFTFTGFAKGYGADEEAESTLAVSANKLEWVQLDVKHTFYRTNTSTEVNHQNQIDTVYFSVPKRLFDDYGKLQRIKAEWYEYVTKEILVTSNQDFYNAVKPYIGVDCSTRNDNIDYFFATWLSYSSGMGNFWNCSGGWNLPSDIVCANKDVIGGNIGKLNNLYYVFPTANWCDIKEYDPYADNVESSGGVSSNRLYEYIKSYDKSFEKGTLPIKTQSISADLFEDDIEVNRKMDNERGKIQKGYSYYDFDAELDLQEWQGWSDKDHAFWENSKMVGFWNALFGKVPEENGKTISPIQVIEKDSPLMKLSDTELVDELFINYSDISEFRKTYNEAITVNGKDDEEKVVVLFRFAVTDYYSESADIVKGNSYNKKMDGQAYVAKETVFFDFDIIQLTFNKKENYTVIPCVSSPIDIVNAITTPTHVPDDTPWWYYVVAFVLFILVVVLLYKLIKGVLSLVFKR